MPEAVLLWRMVAVGAALALVVTGLVGLVGIARDEWRRESPDRARYLRVVARFVLAFLVMLVATS